MQRFLSFELGCAKPHTKIFDRVALELAARPEECLFIDDLATNVAGAERAGWRGKIFEGVEALERFFF